MFQTGFGVRLSLRGIFDALHPGLGLTSGIGSNILYFFKKLR
jgi:hypothetical protein